jgi:transcriptional regulator with XRE-family HTH domain
MVTLWYILGMKIAEALAAAAKDAGMNDVQIAAAVGVSQATANRWLRGKREPLGQTLVALVRAVPGFGQLIGVSVGSEADSKPTAEVA